MIDNNKTVEKQIFAALQDASDPERAMNLQRFFKTGPGDYGEGDIFFGITVPMIRKIANTYSTHASIQTCTSLLSSPIHEVRLAALLIMVQLFKTGDAETQKNIFSCYLANMEHINNWDLVDLSAPRIVGAYLQDKPRDILYELAGSKNLWKRRVSIVSTSYFINKGESTDTLKISDLLISDKHDLIHKAVGWMLREVGKNISQELLEDHLKTRYLKMPRTMLRYTIERFPEERRQMYLKGTI